MKRAKLWIGRLFGIRTAASPSPPVKNARKMKRKSRVPIMYAP